MTDFIRIRNLPEDATPDPADEIAIDGETTRRTKLVDMLNTVRPFAAKAEAEAGEDTTKTMNPQNVRDAIIAIGGALFGTAEDIDTLWEALTSWGMSDDSVRATNLDTLLVSGLYRAASVDVGNPLGTTGLFLHLANGGNTAIQLGFTLDAPGILYRIRNSSSVWTTWTRTVFETRTISAAGLASGGGDLSANRVITVTEASLAQAQAGTSGTVAMTPRRVKDFFDAQPPTDNSTKADKTTTVTGAGLATGGGDLSANRVITVPKATLADFAGGTEDAKALTPFAEMEAAAKRGEWDGDFAQGVAFWSGSAAGNYSNPSASTQLKNEPDIGHVLEITGDNIINSRVVFRIQREKVYRLRVRARKISGGGSFRAGLRFYDKDMNPTATASMLYMAPYSRSLVAADGIVEFVSYITGDAGDAGTYTTRQFPPDTVFCNFLVRPNYGDAAAVSQLIKVWEPEDVTHLFTGGGARDATNFPAIINGTGEWKLSDFAHGAGRGVEARDTAALSNMIASGELNIKLDPVEFKIDAGRYALNPNTSIKGAGKASRLKANDPAQNVALLRIASGVRLEAFDIEGPAATISSVLGGQTAIDTGNTGADIENVRLIDLGITGFRWYGVHGHRMKGLRSRGVHINEVGRAGWLMVGGKDCKHYGDTVRNIGPGSGGSAPLINAYGFNYGNDGAAAGFPVPQDIYFFGCGVEDNPSWTGFDFHAGDNVNLIDCWTRRVVNPVYFGPSSGTNNNGCINWSLIGGFFDGTGLTYTRAAIIAAWASGSMGGQGGRIIGPRIKNHGLNAALFAAAPTLSLEGAIHLAYQSGVLIDSPNIELFHQVAILFRRDVEDTLLRGHVIRNGVATNGRADCILVAEAQNTDVSIDKGKLRRTGGASLRGVVSEGTGLASIYGARVHKQDMVGIASPYVQTVPFHSDSTAP